MQDNWNIEELSDQAWGKMKIVLDQEMPVQTGRKRRPLFWLLFSLGLILAGIAIVWNRPTEAVADLTGTAVETTGSELPQNEGNATTKVFDKPSITGEVAEKGVISPGENGLVAEQRSDSNQNAPVTIDSHLKIPKIKTSDKHIAITKETDEMESLKQKALGESGPIKEELLPLEDQDLKEIKPSILNLKEEFTKASQMNLTALSKAAIKPLELPANPMNNPYYSKKSIVVAPEFHFGGISGQFSGIDGWFAEIRTGITLDRKRKWSLQTGLGVHRQTRALEIERRNTSSALEAASPTQDQNQSPDTVTGISPPMANVSFAQAVESSGIHWKSTYLDLPLVVQWQMKPRWSLGVGSRLSWRLSSSWQRQNGAGNLLDQNKGSYSFDFNQSRNELTFFQSTSNASASTITLNDFQVAGTVEVAFRTGNQWKFRLQYQHGFSNLLKSSSYQMLDRGLWFGLGKRF